MGLRINSEMYKMPPLRTFYVPCHALEAFNVLFHMSHLMSFEHAGKDKVRSPRHHSQNYNRINKIKIML